VKIEGFFRVCRARKPTGSAAHEVVIPKTNAGDLMLDEEVVEACAAGRFRITTVETIEDAMEVLTGESWLGKGKRPGLRDRAVAALTHLADVQALVNAPARSRRAPTKALPRAARTKKR
jgi:predicted ATP-dependent protease